MSELSSLSAGLQQDLKTQLEPIGVAYVNEPPAGVAHGAAGPASCSYWKRALDGEVFFTAADDHLSCPIGAHTHAAPMSSEKSAELMGMIGTMVQLGYLSMAEVPKIPQRKSPLRFAVYAPLSKMPVKPDLALVRGPPRS